jgi:hypothetical protein
VKPADVAIAVAIESAMLSAPAMPVLLLIVATVIGIIILFITTCATCRATGVIKDVGGPVLILFHLDMHTLVGPADCIWFTATCRWVVVPTWWLMPLSRCCGPHYRKRNSAAALACWVAVAACLRVLVLLLVLGISDLRKCSSRKFSVSVQLTIRKVR